MEKLDFLNQILNEQQDTISALWNVIQTKNQKLDEANKQIENLRTRLEDSDSAWEKKCNELKQQYSDLKIIKDSIDKLDKARVRYNEMEEKLQDKMKKTASRSLKQDENQQQLDYKLNNEDETHQNNSQADTAGTYDPDNVSLGLT